MATDSFDVLGQTIASEISGADGGGLDVSFLTNAAAELIQRGVKTHEQKQAAEKSMRESEAQLAKAKVADAALAAAEANRDLAGQSKDASRIAANEALLGVAARNAALAGVGLSPDAVSKRVDAAHAAAARAAEEALAEPGSNLKAAKMRAWQKVAIAASSVAASGSTSLDLARKGGGGNLIRFFTREYGGLPVWGWGLAGGVTLTGVALLVKTLRKRK